ncbi:MAG: MFS transporter [Acidimicrobiaceae bacterium]|nr:MFS transporter [Acidimicrobiaceae bacterium]MYE97245.1 MFS transporter [Acidimicrobiaceae bacterium]MYH44964.1 MFS transporter [Acidimicrobiaceae bacterium]MYI54465.1 MFS transporter [Acidimicrobiaceae bacterium]
MSSQEPSGPGSGERAGPPGRIEPRLWALFGATFFSMALTMGQITFLGKQVFDMTGEPFFLGLLGLAEFVPAFLLAPVSGMVADRFERRLVFAWGLGGEVLASLGLFFYVASDPASVLPIYGLVVTFGTARAFLMAVSRAMPMDLAPEGARERMVALNVAGWQGGFIVGPVAFGLAFDVDPALPYLLAAGCAAAGIGLLMIVPRSDVRRAALAPGAGARAVISQALDGLRYVRRNRVVLGAISLDLFAVFLGGVHLLLPAIAADRLGVGAVGLGWLASAVGIGAAAVMLTLSVRPFQRRVGPALLGSVALFGVGTIVLGLTRSYVVAFVALLVLGGADAVSIFVRGTIVPLATPEEMRGRVLAVEYVFIGGSNELGGFRSGVTAALLGVAGAVVFGGAGTLAVVAAWWMVFPELRRIDHFSEVRPDT